MEGCKLTDRIFSSSHFNGLIGKHRPQMKFQIAIVFLSGRKLCNELIINNPYKVESDPDAYWEWSACLLLVSSFTRSLARSVLRYVRHAALTVYHPVCVELLLRQLIE